MDDEKIIDSLGQVDDQHIEESESGKIIKKLNWKKWGMMAAGLCLAAVAAIAIPLQFQHNSKSKNQSTTAQVYTLANIETIEVELVAWQDEGFKAIVTNAGSNSIFPVGAKLFVYFENTEIVLEDGTTFVYSSDNETKAGDIGWNEGDMIKVEFQSYEQYDSNNGYYNSLIAYHIEKISNMIQNDNYFSGSTKSNTTTVLSIQSVVKQR